MPDRNAPGLSAATGILFSWSLLTLGVRAWVKLGKNENWGWDDSTIAASFAFSLAHIACIFRAVNDGLGLPDDALADPVRDGIEKLLFAGQLLYIVSVGLSKVSTGLFIAQLTRHGAQVKRAYALAALCGSWIVMGVFVIALRGDLHQPWSTIDGSQIMFVRWTVVEVIGLVLEAALWGLTFHIIWKLSMPWTKRCLILAIFGTRLLLIPLVSVRLLWLSPAKNPDNPISSITAYILTECVLQFAFISASVTCLKPFLKPFGSTYMVTTGAHSTSGWRSSRHPSSDPYYALNSVQRAEKERVTISTTTQDSNNPPMPEKTQRTARRSFRPDNFTQQATVSASSHESSSNANEGDNSVIRKTETWSVRVEE